MKRLVEGQKIRIDNHRRGTTGIDYYDDPANDIHLDKTLYDEKSKKTYQIRVPLNSKRSVSVVSKNGKEVIPKRLLEEVAEAFENPKKRSKFVAEISDILKNYPVQNKGITDIEKVFVAMKRVAISFDLGWDDNKIVKFIYETKTEGTEYISLIIEPLNTFYLSFMEKGIVISDYKRIEHQNEKNWRKI